MYGPGRHCRRSRTAAVVRPPMKSTGLSPAGRCWRPARCSRAKASLEHPQTDQVPVHVHQVGPKQADSSCSLRLSHAHGQPYGSSGCAPVGGAVGVMHPGQSRSRPQVRPTLRPCTAWEYPASLWAWHHPLLFRGVPELADTHSSGTACPFQCVRAVIAPHWVGVVVPSLTTGLVHTPAILYPLTRAQPYGTLFQTVPKMVRTICELRP